MLASEVAAIVSNNYLRGQAVKEQIDYMEEKIKSYAKQGRRNCIMEFYHKYNLEIELKEYFTKNGFTFKLVTDDVCGGVLQSPYWIICW